MTLSARAKELRASKDARPKKIDRLRAFVADSKNGLHSMAPLPHPLNSRVEITGLIPEKCSVFKSNLFPMLLYFSCSDGSEYPVIFKNGDDMRQDQLVIQLFTLMDRLLRKENLDLRLSCYDVLATGALEGMAQFVPSKTIAAIVSEHGTLLNYLRAHHPDEGSVGTYGVQSSVIDTFVRSCGTCYIQSSVAPHLIIRSSAGYCVVTYILGVGDRHLDNLLLAPDGSYISPTSNTVPSYPSRIHSFHRSFFPRRFRLHPRPRSQTLPSSCQSLQRNGRRHGRRLILPLQPFQVFLLHGLHDPPQERKPHPQSRRAHGRCEYPRYQASRRPRTDSGKVQIGLDGGRGYQAL